MGQSGVPAVKYLTKDEIRRVLVAVDNKRDRLLLQLGFILGCRVSEVVTIRLKNIMPDRLRLWDEKKNCFREAVIDEATRSQLECYLTEEWKPEPHRLHQLFYMSTKTANRVVKRWFAVAGIPKDRQHWHVVRHSYVIHSLEAGIAIGHIVAQTGDSPSTILRVYGVPSIDLRRQVINEKGCYWK